MLYDKRLPSLKDKIAEQWKAEQTKPQKGKKRGSGRASSKKSKKKKKYEKSKKS